MVVLLLIAACSSIRTPQLDLHTTSADGTEANHRIPGVGWTYDSLMIPSMTWPDAAEWDADTDIGMMLQFVTVQPGTYATTAYLFVNGDFRNAEPTGTTLHITDVTWTGNTEFPFTYEGRLEGTAPISGTTFDASFHFHNLSCDSADTSSNCATLWPSAPAQEQVWTVDVWSGLDTCPSAISSRFTDGDTLTIPPDGTVTVGSHEAECIPQSDSRSVCGGSERVDIDGVTWIVATEVFAGNTYAGDAPDLYVRAGPVSEDRDGACFITPLQYTPVSGTGI